MTTPPEKQNWPVTGHWRHNPDGTKTWVNPYVKSPYPQPEPPKKEGEK